MTARPEFLSQVWERYPSADAEWFDVRSFQASGQNIAIVAGRLMRRQQGWTLESGGALLEFSFSPALSWLRPLAVAPSPSLFEPGDLIAVELSGAPDRRVAHRVLLLTPTAGESEAASAFTVSRSEQWASYISAIRGFFVSRDFTEARTPTLVPSPGTEPFLDPFSTEWTIGSTARRLYLPTSPEFHLKQMLVRGWTRIFELKTCFRNGEISEHHQPEFLMLEWYRAYSNLEVIADDVDFLLQTVAAKFGHAIPRLKRTTIAQLFSEAFGGFDLKPSTTRDELASLAARQGIAIDASDSFDDVFFRLFLDKIEARLGVGGPLLVSGYPPSQAALSRIGAHGFAERFEVYWNGLELANAFHELNDPNENEKRFAEDAAKKKALGKPPVPRDENLVRALQKGMPPSGGIALGVDRLFMALFEIPEIAMTRAFPLTLRG